MFINKKFILASNSSFKKNALLKNAGLKFFLKKTQLCDEENIKNQLLKKI